jgi:hypothetical protein
MYRQSLQLPLTPALWWLRSDWAEAGVIEAGVLEAGVIVAAVFRR